MSSTPPGRNHWLNLMGYMQQVHCGGLPGNDQSPQSIWNRGERSLLEHAITCMFSTTEALRQRPWQEVKTILEMHRPTLGSLDDRWMEE